MLYRILNYSRKIRQVKLVLPTSLIFFLFYSLLCMVPVKLKYSECYAVLGIVGIVHMVLFHK